MIQVSPHRALTLSIRPHWAFLQDPQFCHCHHSLCRSIHAWLTYTLPGTLFFWIFVLLAADRLPYLHSRRLPAFWSVTADQLWPGPVSKLLCYSVGWTTYLFQQNLNCDLVGRVPLSTWPPLCALPQSLVPYRVSLSLIVTLSSEFNNSTLNFPSLTSCMVSISWLDQYWYNKLSYRSHVCSLDWRNNEPEK